MRVFLIGFSGSGKTTVGPILAKMMGLSYFDSDMEVERVAKRRIAQIFADEGEGAFRDLEHKVIVRLSGKGSKSAVIGLGGGAFAYSRNRKIIADAGVVVYLRCELSELYRRLQRHRDRPLLFGKSATRNEILAKMRSLTKNRRRYYEMAEIAVSTTKSRPRDVALKIKRRLQEYGY